jgi:hypothetical protein
MACVTAAIENANDAWFAIPDHYNFSISFKVIINSRKWIHIGWEPTWGMTATTTYTYSMRFTPEVLIAFQYT